MNDLFLVEAESASESKAPWDYFKILRRIPSKDIIEPLSQRSAPW